MKAQLLAAPVLFKFVSFIYADKIASCIFIPVLL